MKTTGKMLAVLLCIVLLVSGAGCSGADTSWAYETDGEKMPAGVYLYFMYTGYLDAYDEYLTAADTSAEDFEYPDFKGLLAAQIDGQTGSAWIEDRAKAYSIRYYGAKFKAAEADVTLSEEDRNNITSFADAVWAGNIDAQTAMMYGLLSAELYEENGISRASFEEAYASQYLSSALFTALYGEGGEFAVSEEELIRAFDDLYAQADYMYMQKVKYDESDESGRTQEDVDRENAEIRAKAETFLTRLKDEDPVELQYEFDRAINPDKENTKREPGSLTHTVRKASVDPERPELFFSAALIEAPKNEGVLVEDEDLFYLIYRHDLLTDRSTLEEYRGSILSELKFEEFEQKLTEWGMAQNPTPNGAAMSMYTAGKLKTGSN